MTLHTYQEYQAHPNHVAVRLFRLCMSKPSAAPAPRWRTAKFAPFSVINCDFCLFIYVFADRSSQAVVFVVLQTKYGTAGAIARATNKLPVIHGCDYVQVGH